MILAAMSDPRDDQRVTPSTISEAVGLILIDDRGWILLQLRDENGTYPHHWATVGGAVEEGETLEAAIRREMTEETAYHLHSPLEIGAIATLALSTGECRRVTVFFALYDGIQPIHCLEGVRITFVDPTTLDTLLIYPGQKDLILETLRRYREAHAP
jgi:8-oxo-dGTP pyrophosphatase MutT (NUDIX family)